jgi:hypothetical protein
MPPLDKTKSEFLDLLILEVSRYVLDSEQLLPVFDDWNPFAVSDYPPRFNCS